MASRTPKYFYEPWTAAKSVIWDVPYKFGPPNFSHDPERLSEVVSEWESSKHRAERDADWVIRGSRIYEPGPCHNINGSLTMATDQGIIALTKHPFPKDGADHADIAKRITACVNACAGIHDPESLIRDVRALMLAYLQGDAEDPRADPRVGSILGRCIPQEELNL